jgi:cobalt transporter subunit CbtA
MTRRIFASALFAGLAAGAVAFLLHTALVTPVLLEGELYETGALTHFAGAAAEAAAHADHGTPAGIDASRLAGSFFMSLVIYTGFALLLTAAFAASARLGIAIDARKGLLWGLAGFAAVQLAPALGLPPELPGTPAEDVVLRQTWWVATVAATAAGLALAFLGRGWLPVAGVVLIAAPHLWGAPVLPFHGGTAPPELAGLFVARALVVGAVAWAALGLATGFFWRRLA